MAKFKVNMCMDCVILAVAFYCEINEVILNKLPCKWQTICIIPLDLDAIRDFVCKEMKLSLVYVPWPCIITGNVQQDNVIKYLLKDTIDEKADIKEVGP